MNMHHLCICILYRFYSQFVQFVICLLVRCLLVCYSVTKSSWLDVYIQQSPCKFIFELNGSKSIPFLIFHCNMVSEQVLIALYFYYTSIFSGLPPASSIGVFCLSLVYSISSRVLFFLWRFSVCSSNSWNQPTLIPPILLIFKMTNPPLMIHISSCSPSLSLNLRYKESD